MGYLLHGCRISCARASREVVVRRGRGSTIPRRDFGGCSWWVIGKWCRRSRVGSFPLLATGAVQVEPGLTRRSAKNSPLRSSRSPDDDDLLSPCGRAAASGMARCSADRGVRRSSVSPRLALHRWGRRVEHCCPMWQRKVRRRRHSRASYGEGSADDKQRYRHWFFAQSGQVLGHLEAAARFRQAYASSSSVGGWKRGMYLSISVVGMTNTPSAGVRLRISSRR